MLLARHTSHFFVVRRGARPSNFILRIHNMYGVRLVRICTGLGGGALASMGHFTYLVWPVRRSGES